MEHKFAPGQSVRSIGTTLPSQYGRAVVMMPAGSYDIVRQMPAIGRQLQYRVRSALDGHERVVVEDDLCR